MKRITLFLLISFITFVSYSQGIGDDLPASWDLNIETNVVDPIVLPPIDLEGIAIEDSINDLDKSLPWRYGISRSIQLDMENDGVWTTLHNGDKIWQIAVKSPEALNLSVNFNEFYLPNGTKMHLYNDDRTEVSRTYSNTQNRSNQLLGSWFISGDIIWIEYFEPSYVNQQPKLELNGLIHGYRMGKVNLLVDNLRGLNDSGDCNYDVNCPIGSDFNSKKDIVKKAVALLNLGNGFLCSASLINTTLEDKTPYLLTANHCLANSDPSFWSVRFNWVSPSPVCGSEDESSDIQSNFTMSGAELKASNSLSDFALVELFNEIPNSWDVSFAGWDNSEENPLFEVGIHHPNGDIMKICRDDSGAIKENANGTEVWLIGGVSAGTGNGWEIGTTESGSSGSPLFDQDGRIIGQLYAGLSFCNGTENNHEYDIYGRFGVSWNSGSTPDSRLIDWLDPLDTGQTTTDSLLNILSVPDNEIEGNLDVYPNPASSVITVMNGRYPNLNYHFYNLLGQEILAGSLSNTMNEINVERLSKGVYFLHLVDKESNADITKKIIISR